MSGFRFQGLGFRVLGLGFRVWGLGFREGSLFRAIYFCWLGVWASGLKGVGFSISRLQGSCSQFPFEGFFDLSATTKFRV